MRSHRFQAILALAALFACALVAVGCGDDDDSTTSSAATTTTTTAGESAEQSIDAAVQSCSDEAQQLGGAAGTALSSACTSVGSSAKQALSEGGEQAKKALAQAESSCKSSASQLPSSQAQDALTKLCNAISAAE